MDLDIPFNGEFNMYDEDMSMDDFLQAAGEYVNQNQHAHLQQLNNQHNGDIEQYILQSQQMHPNRSLRGTSLSSSPSSQLHSASGSASPALLSSPFHALGLSNSPPSQRSSEFKTSNANGVEGGEFKAGSEFKGGSSSSGMNAGSDASPPHGKVLLENNFAQHHEPTQYLNKQQQNQGSRDFSQQGTQPPYDLVRTFSVTFRRTRSVRLRVGFG